MEYRNYMEELTAENAEEVLAKYKDICKCQRCKLDIIALALNNLPAIVAQAIRTWIFYFVKRI